MLMLTILRTTTIEKFMMKIVVLYYIQAQDKIVHNFTKKNMSQQKYCVYSPNELTQEELLCQIEELKKKLGKQQARNECNDTKSSVYSMKLTSGPLGTFSRSTNSIYQAVPQVDETPIRARKNKTIISHTLILKLTCRI